MVSARALVALASATFFSFPFIFIRSSNLAKFLSGLLLALAYSSALFLLALALAVKMPPLVEIKSVFLLFNILSKFSSAEALAAFILTLELGSVLLFWAVSATFRAASVFAVAAFSSSFLFSSFARAFASRSSSFFLSASRSCW